jgi:uncharacterized protein
MKTFLTAEWQNLIMANYEIDPTILLTYLPKDVELDYFEGKTYISLVGFLFAKSKIFKVPIPLMGTFEEVNLRFYVKRIINGEIRRGVVFINETVPSKVVAWMANKLYKEHYIAIPTKYDWQIAEDKKQISYQWKVNNKWNNIIVNAGTTNLLMPQGSMEEFIFEHYYGYTKASEIQTIEYKVNHPRWAINKVNSFDIDCDFAACYGQDFSILNNAMPTSIFIAEGSAVSIDWKRVWL